LTRSPTWNSTTNHASVAPAATAFINGQSDDHVVAGIDVVGLLVGGGDDQDGQGEHGEHGEQG
jgi:hypothetical protein